MCERNIINLHLSIGRCLEKMELADHLFEAAPNKGLATVLSAVKEDLEFAKANVRAMSSAPGEPADGGRFASR